MKKMNTKTFFNWRKAGATGLLAAGMALFSMGNSYGQVLVSANFTGQTLPTGWSNIDNGTSGQIWEFDNPYPRTITGGTPGFDADFAILDSDNYGSSGAQDASLETPTFNASTPTGAIFLSFDNQYRGYYNSTADVDVWNGTTWVNVLQMSGSTSNGYPNDANHKLINITTACGSATAAKVRFHYTGDWAYWWAIDNVKIENVTCGSPDGLSASSITATTATVSWTASTIGTPTNGYQYYYNTTGIVPSATTTATGSTTDTFINLTSLSPNTVYYAWARSLCSTTDTSSWSTLVSFQTPCVADTAYWIDDVESQSGTSSNSTVDPCWTASPQYGSGYAWNVSGTGTTPSSSTGPDAAHSGSKIFFTEASSGSQGDTAFLISPGVYVGNLTLPALKFYYHMYGSTMGNMYIQATDNGGTTWTTVDSIIGEQQTSGTDPWLSRLIILNGYSGVVSIRFIGVRGSNFYGDMAIDDISIEESPTCLPPNSIAAQSILVTSADINWNVPIIVPGTGYEYYYNTTGTAPGVGTIASGSTTDTFATLNGLTQNTTYYVWIRSICSSTDNSDWSAPAFIFTTACATANVPYTVPMATGTPSATPPGLPDCMSDEALNPNDNEGWYIDSGSPGSSNGFSGNYLRSDYTGSSDGPVNNWVYTNKINMTAGTYYKLSFKYGNNSSSYTEKLAVAIGRAATADSMSPLVFDDTTISFAGSKDTNVYFMAPTTDAYYIGFHAHSDEDQYYLFLNNISVDSLPTCYVANSLIANNITTTSANVAWFGTALQYNIEYGPTGFTQGNGTIVTSTTGTYSLTNLNPNTTYDFYVEDVCLPGAITAGWSTAGTFTTLCDTPMVSVGHDTAFCTGGSIVLYTGNTDTGRTVLWSDGSSADSLVINTSGNYYAKVTNQYGCSSTDTVHINVKTYPVINLGNDTTICTGNTVTLDAGTQPFGTTYYWNTTQTTQTIQVSDSGQYKVVADNKGCISSDSIHISEIAAPNLNGITITQNSDGSYSYSASGVQNATGLDWDFGDGSPHSSDPNPTHTYLNTGNYTVTLVVSNACGSDSATANIRFIAAGIHQINLNNDQLKVYPNPARDRVTLKNESQYKMESVSVYNVLGQEVFHSNTNNQSEYELNVQGLASGMYNIKINFKDGNWISRKFEIRK